MSCELCEIRKAEILYQDKEIVVAVKDNVLTPGQITVFPKEHFTIMEMVPSKIMGRCLGAAKKISIAVFENMGAQGTNILIRNGLAAGQNLPHFCIEIIPRQENDGLKLSWEPKQLMEDELDQIFLQLTDDGEVTLVEDKRQKKEEVEVLDEDSEDVEENKKDNGKDNRKNPKTLDKGKENYLLKSLRRMP